MKSFTALRRLALTCACFALLQSMPGCTALPSDGPLLSEVRQELARQQRVPFLLVKLAPEFVPVLEPPPPPVTNEAFITDLGPQELLVGIGDVLTITIVEAGAGGLFSAPPASGVSGGEQGARVVTLPDATVDGQGNVVVPFVGVLDVAGHSTTDIAATIQSSLAGQAIQPQVMVNVARGPSNQVTVTGNVKTPGLYPVHGNGETLLQTIAAAGGATDAPGDTMVQLIRFGNVHRIRLLTLLDVPATNIHVRVGDTINLSAQPRTYTMLGAVDHVQEAPLPLAPLTLAEAIGRAGGLLDSRADAHGLLLFRFEPPEVMERVLAVQAKLDRRNGDDAGARFLRDKPAKPGGPVPVVYALDLRSASGLFLARQLTVREKDLIYLPDAGSVQLQKFLDILRMTASPVTDSATSARSF
jgi:polysaccharide export outer membrane protein